MVNSRTLRAVSLRSLLPTTSFVGCADVPAYHVTDHHEQCVPGSLFVAIAGTRHDGRKYIADAVANGAVSILVDEPQTDVTVPQCVVPNVRDAFSQICLTLASRPDRAMDLTGVTGTNGKTTVTWLLQSIFESAGRTCGRVGTIDFSDGRATRPASQTTPGPIEFTQLLGRMQANGVKNAFVEISSHALDQSRLGGLRLASAVITNVTQDHFDYHGGPAEYLTAKERIADYCSYDAPLVVNADDAGCQQLIPRWQRRRVIRFGLNSGTDSRGEILEMHEDHTRARFEILGERFECDIPLIGRHNVSNCVAAATVAVAANIPTDRIAHGLTSLKFVPGRLQPVKTGQKFRVFVDYAHTPDAISQVVSALRPTTAGRLICVFGAGGDRDASKRPLLGAAASAADVVVVTSDNPRSEDPSDIIAQVREGVAGVDCHVEVARRTAIEWAIGNARYGDCVLITGKGHETTQQIGDVQVPFDDRMVATEVLAELNHKPKPAASLAREASWTQ